MNGLNQSGGRIAPGEDRLEVEAVRPISEWTQPKWWTYCPGRGQTGSGSGSSHK